MIIVQAILIFFAISFIFVHIKEILLVSAIIFVWLIRVSAPLAIFGFVAYAVMKRIT